MKSILEFLGFGSKEPLSVLDVYYSEVHKDTPVSECINRSNSMYGTLRRSMEVPEMCVNDDNTLIISEGITYTFSEKSKGGIIAFSGSVNAKVLSKNKLANKVKQLFATANNYVNKKSKIDKIASKYNDAWTIGNYVNGRYTSQNGSVFNEKSLSLEIIGIDEKTLIKIAGEICGEFGQECVLVRSYESGKIMLVDDK